MGLFDRNNYDRDYGYRGGGMSRGYDRDMMDRAGDSLRHGWNRVRNGAHDTFHAGGRGYDRDMGGSTWNSPFGNAYGRDPGMGNRGGMWGGGTTGNRSGWSFGAYDREYGYGGSTMGNAGGRMSYDMDYGAGSTTYGHTAYGGSDTGYDRDYKSRQQTNQGDPFGDRARNTPIRMTRGEFGHDQGYDRDMSAGRGDLEADRGYMHGVGYDPYYNRDDARAGTRWGSWGAGRGYDTGYRGANRGYDSGWF